MSRERSQWEPVAVATAVLLAFSIFLGGASRLHEVRLALVELAALPLLLLAAWAGQRNPGGLPTRFALALVAGLVAVPLIQLVPIPTDMWRGLPGRAEISLALDLANLSPDWLPVSLAPERTWRSFLALIPPVAMFFGVLAVNDDIRLRLVQGLIAATVLAIFLGAAQLASKGTGLYLWPTTDAGSVVGFFANRNHMATLCLAALPFAAILGARSMRRGGRSAKLEMWISILFTALVVVGIGVIRSRAGFLLLGPALAASLLAAWVSARERPGLFLLGMSGAGGVAVALVLTLALGPILQRFDPTGGREGRFENWPVVAEAANIYLPLGSGIGSFDAVYRSVEPLERLDATYFNQAHNEYLETWLEAGWPGAVLVVAFLVWFGRRSWTTWSAAVSTNSDLGRAASVAIGVVLFHSALDYPLRTETMAVVFALCCALLERSARSAPGDRPAARERVRVRAPRAA